MNIIPTIIEKNYEGERAYDIFSRLLEERIIMLTGEITDQLSSVIIAQLLFLQAKDPKKDIFMYINSPGGSISAGMAIYDTMHYLKCNVSTICIGMCASMAAFLLAGGTKGKRLALPNSEVMIHQPLGGVQGQATEIEIVAKRIVAQKKALNQMLADNTGQSLKTITRDTDRDNFMTANEALSYGIIDRIIYEKE